MLHQERSSPGRVGQMLERKGFRLDIRRPVLGIVANGLLLSGLNFYWQQVGTGLLIFCVLAIGFANRKAAGRA